MYLAICALSSTKALACRVFNGLRAEKRPLNWKAHD